MTNNQTISLEGTPDSLDIFRFANAQAAKGFSSKLPKLETPCEFFKKNKFRRFTYKNFCKTKNYFVHLQRLTIVDDSTENFYDKNKNYPQECRKSNLLLRCLQRLSNSHEGFFVYQIFNF